MSEPHSPRRVIVDGIDLRSALMFPRIMGAVPAGLRPGRVFIAFALLVVLSAFGSAWDAVMPATVSPSGLFVGKLDERAEKASRDLIRTQVVTRLSKERLGDTNPDTITAAQARRMLEAAVASGDEVAKDPAAVSRMAAAIEAARPRGSFEALRDAIALQWFTVVRSAVSLDPGAAATAIGGLIFTIPSRMWSVSPAFCVVFGIFAAAMSGMAAGGLARMNAFDLAESGHPTVMDALGYARRRMHALGMGPVLPFVVALVCMAIATGIGLGMSLPVLDVVSALLTPISLLLAGVAVLAVMVVAFGLTLFAPAVACDGADAVESAQRAGAYLLAHPLLALGYAGVALVALAVGTVMVDYALTQSWNWTLDAYAVLGESGPARTTGRLMFLESAAPGVGVPAGLSARISAGTLGFWRTALCGLEGAAILSMVVAASTRVYLLLRRAADGVEPNDIWADRPLSGS
jgi:hypothetical protein